MFDAKEFCLTIWIFAFVWHTSNAALKIINGDEVVPHSLPYVVALEGKLSEHPLRCGGSLIKPNKILTAASCLYGAENVTAILGAHDLNASETTQVKLSVSNFTIHEKYDPETHRNDIAIINLEKYVNLTDSIKTIPTPTILDLLKTYTDDLSLVPGWGKSNESDPVYSSVLRKIETIVIPNLACTIPYFGQIHDSQMCTSGLQEGQNICLGDGGSPVVINGTQVGIVSFGSDFGCSVGIPGVHTRLTSFHSWLEKNIK